MKRLAVFLLPALAWAAIWPENFGAFHRVSAQAAALTEPALWEEFGFQAGETARYASAGAKFTGTAWRLQDPTGALAAFEWQRPADAKPSSLAKLAVQTAKGVLLVHGNYLFAFDGYQPQVSEVAAVIENLPNLDDSPLPVLPSYLPSGNLVANSERYILGPAALAKFEPGVPPSTAAFHLGAEAQMGTFHTAAGDMRLAIFNYPTPQIARQQVQEFQKLPSAMAKRSGPLVAVVLSPPDRDAAERLLAQIRYQAAVTLSERVPTRRDNIGNLIINAFILIGILLAFSAVAGITMGGLRVLLRRGGKGVEEDPMILLHLEDR
ncbi:MAG TPA: DUF6599 family protein [Bryobacteraceae bacterium]|nr:DUF6599 family protein [Bryobacteraceae bacterium]